MRLVFYGLKNAAISVVSFIFFLICAICPINPMRITVSPAVFDLGNEYYAVVWETSLKGSGYVSYTYEGEEKIIWDAPGGAVSTDDTIHMVKVPKKELQNNTYTVGSRHVPFKFGYHALRGRSATSDEIAFKGEGKQDDIKILCISDIHEMERKMRKALSYMEETPDLVVMLGDITSEMRTKSQFTDYLLSDAAELSGGSVPVIFTRGNHETRGEYAAQMLEYFPTETGQFYFTFEFGALSGLVLDSTEDKEDDHPEYSGLVDFASYREEEYQWLTSLKKEEFDGKYKLAFCHDPHLEDFFGMNWMEPIKELGMDMLVSGHYHTNELVDGELPVFIDGGKITNKQWIASMITLKDGKISMFSVDNNGETMLDETVEIE